MSGFSLRDFANKQNERGGRQHYFRKWKDEGDHSATVFIHPRGMILGLWRHPFLKLEPREDKNTGVKTREVWMDRLVCYEESEVLEKQNYRNRETGAREYPPVLCPFCLMLEHLQELVATKQIDWRQPLFKFEGTDPSKVRLFNVGGVTGQFNSRRLTEAQRAQLAGVEPPAQQDPKWYPVTKWNGPVHQKGPKAAFMQDMRAGLEYALPVVDVNDLKGGVQVAIERASLGDKIQEAIKKSIKGACSPQDPEGQRGDPSVYPFAFRFDYDERQEDPKKKYDVTKMDHVPVSPDVKRLLDGPCPDFSKLAERFNLLTLRARLEQHMLVKLPLDHYFAPALKAAKDRPAESPREESNPVPNVGRTEEQSTRGYAGGAAYPPGSAPDAPPDPGYGKGRVQDPPPQEELFGCETPGCPGEMRATDPECPQCHRVYEVVADPEPPPPPKPPLRPRSAAAASQASAPVVSPPQEFPAPVASAGEDRPAAWPGDPNDDVPF